MAADRESEVIEFHRAWIKAAEQPFDSRKPFPRALRSLAAAAFGLPLLKVRTPRKVPFPESSAAAPTALGAGTPSQPQPQPRRRRSSVGTLIKRAEKEGKSVTSITMPDGTVLHFGEPQTEASNPWLADLHKVAQQ
jgi:hypothetical protein